MRRFRIAVAVCAIASAIGGCGGSPMPPSPIIPPPPVQPPPVNALPVIETITAQGRRPGEPAGFADLSEIIDLTARVRDDETALSDLEFQWSATVGTFAGSGPVVTWRAPDTGETPVPVTLSLKVVERYGHPGGPRQFQQDVSSSTTVSLHDSVKEVSDIGRQFLLDFSDSSIRDVNYVMRNFQPGCYGTAAEMDQVTENRRRYRIIESRVGEASTRINFGGICPYPLGARRGDACTTAPVYWKSIDQDARNAVGAVQGTSWLASFYIREERRWRLCDSSFDGQVAPNMRAFVR